MSQPRRTRPSQIAAHDPGATRTGKTIRVRKNSFFPNSKNIGIGSAHSRNPRRVVTRRTAAEEEEECARESLLFSTSTPSGTTLHLIRWCLSPPTSNVGLNFSTTLHLQNSAMHMGHTWANLRFFRIAYLGSPLMGPNFNNPPPDLKFPFRDFAKPRFLFIYQCFSRDC